jgi:type I restriction enzyme S subunit
MPVPLPSLDEQAEIAMTVAERLSQIGVAERLIDTNLKRSTRLRQSILKRGFEGKLVPQDPTDEPAAKLLERIAAECRRPLGLARAGKKTKNASRKSRPEGP